MTFLWAVPSRSLRRLTSRWKIRLWTARKTKGKAGPFRFTFRARILRFDSRTELDRSKNYGSQRASSMSKKNARWKAVLCAILLVSGVYLACWGIVSWHASRSLPLASPLPSDEAVSRQTILFLEERTKADPEDFIAQNKLVGYYLQ